MSGNDSPLASLSRDNPSILNKIVMQRQLRLKQEETDEAALKSSYLIPSDRSLVKALESSATGFILECKQSSPSRGLLTTDYQPAEIAKQYQAFVRMAGQ